VVEFQEKGKDGPGLVNAGMYVIRPDIFSHYNVGEIFSFEIDFLQRYCTQLHLRSYVSKGYFIEIGTPEDYDRAQRELGMERN
jgi:D-glycero-alpha-D-manno-heptose 1-phosphate guanylyltransferase